MSMTASSEQTLYCCVDGGASSTRVALFDGAGHRLGLTVAEAASLTLRGDGAWKVIQGALASLFAAVGLTEEVRPHISYGIGLAGASNTRQRDAFVAAAPAAAGLQVATDAYIACIAAHTGRPGAIVVVGTGSVGYRIEAPGRCRVVGGWGFPAGDEGSGAWLGREAVAQVLHVLDGRYRHRPTGLHRAVIAHCGGTRQAMLGWLFQAPPGRFAELAPLVVEHAARGDREGVALATAAGREIEALALRLDPSLSVPLALVGGLAEPLRPFLSERLRSRIRAPEADAITGALRLAQGKVPAETLCYAMADQGKAE
jgi:glucosamine kinase